MTKTTYTKICELCQKSYVTVDSRPQRFCSKKCRATWFNKNYRIYKPHSEITKEKIKKSTRNHFQEHPMSIRIPKEIRICPICKKSFIVRSTLKTVFCSKSCGTKHRNLIYGNTPSLAQRKKNSERMKKLYAGMTKEEMFQQQPWRRNIGKVNAHFVSDWMKNPENQKKRSIAMKQRIFLNPLIRDKQRIDMLNFWQTHPEQREKQREIMNRTLSQPNFSRSQKERGTSRLEKIVASVLTMLQINYIQHKFMRLENHNLFPDFQIIGSNIVIEVNGELWHTKEETQDRINLLKRHDYEPIILWGNDIIKGTKNILRILLTTKLKEYVEVNEAISKLLVERE